MQAVGKSLGGVLFTCTLASMAFGQIDDQGPVTTKQHLKILQPFVGEWTAARFDGNGEIVLKYAWLFDKTAMSFEWGLEKTEGR